jgi:hypothetical protein
MRFKRFLQGLFISVFVVIGAVGFANNLTKIGYSGAATGRLWTEYKSVEGKLRTVINTYWEEIAEQEIPDHELLKAFGSHVAIGTTELVLSEESTGQQFYLSTADEVVATSDSNEDSAGQTGALTLLVEGMTEDVPGTWVRATDTITMTGSPGTGTSTEKFIRVESVRAVTAGSVGANVGTITFTDQGATGTFMVMTPGQGSTKAAIRSIQTGKKLLIRNIWATAAGSKNLEVHLYVREFGKAWNLEHELSLNNSPFRDNILLNSIPAKSDIEIRVHALSAGATGACKAGWLGRTENDD